MQVLVQELNVMFTPYNSEHFRTADLLGFSLNSVKTKKYRVNILWVKTSC